MRVVAGELRGRRIVAPAGRDTRPTTDRVREAIFNALGSAGLLEGALVADLYAGSGALGIEALSRGAEHCVFVETDRSAIAALEENLDHLGLRSRSRVLRSSAPAVVVGLDVDLVLADPPYGSDVWPELLAAVRAPIVVAEADAVVTPPVGWTVFRSRRYGRTWVTFLQRDTD